MERALKRQTSTELASTLFITDTAEKSPVATNPSLIWIEDYPQIEVEGALKRRTFTGLAPKRSISDGAQNSPIAKNFY